MTLIQALEDTAIPTRLWCLTQNAVSTGPTDPLNNPPQAAVWGLGRSAALEHPQQWGGLIDLPHQLDQRALNRLCALLTDPTDEDQIAIRPSGTYVRRLQPAPTTNTITIRTWKPRGTALITGGTGALGAHIARWLARNGAQHLVLTSRQGPAAPGATELQNELTELGTRVTITACDVANRTELAALIQQLHTPDDPIRTVVHTAGINTATMLTQTTPTDLAHITTAKTTGAQHLDELLDHTQLDAFILFSSIAGVWGSGGQSPYAAANAYLDALAQQRRSHGHTATAIAWGPWAEGGMATGEAGEQLRRRGLTEITPQQATTALQQALDHDETLLTITDVDWQRFTPTYTIARPSPLLTDIPQAQQALQTTNPPTTDITPTAQHLANLPEPERHQALLQLIRTHIATVLHHPTPDTIQPDRAFKELGFDSLTAVELRERLNTATGLHLPATLVFDYPTPTTLANYLMAELVPGGAAAARSLLAELDRFETALAEISAGEDFQVRVNARLKALLWKRQGDQGRAEIVDTSEDFQAATDDELFEALDDELGIS
jgi:NAD(P)-dependent dehydrogenase (short-subunit alcohol dehydrogenase family)/acyl carrier protein